MLLPEEIKTITFEQSVFSGYKKEDVDEFLDKVHSEYARIYKENGELVEKLKVCIAKIEEYRRDEKFLNSAILNAQKLNETAMKEIALKKSETETLARKQAEDIVSQAKEQASQIAEETERRIAQIREKTTQEFAETQRENARKLDEQMREYADQIAKTQAELAFLESKASDFRKMVVGICEQQIELMTQIDIVESMPAEELEESAQEKPISEPVVEEAEVLAPVEESEEIVEDEVKESEVVEQPETEAEIDDEELAEELAEEPVAELAEEPVAEPQEEILDEQAEDTEEYVEEEIQQDEAVEELEEQAEAEPELEVQEVITASPVEPDAPVVSIPDEEEEIEDEEEDFQLFGTSPLIFPQDIIEDEEAEKTPAVKEKSNTRFNKKKLKFGVDFDVKKDK